MAIIPYINAFMERWADLFDSNNVAKMVGFPIAAEGCLFLSSLHIRGRARSRGGHVATMALEMVVGLSFPFPILLKFMSPSFPSVN